VRGQGIRVSSFIVCMLPPVRNVTWQSECIVLTVSVARWLWPKSAKWCHKKLLNSAKSLFTNFQLKSATSSEILLNNLSFLTWLKETYEVIQYTVLIFHLAIALNKHGLKMPALPNTLFGPQFSFSQHFEQRNCSLPRFLCDTQFLTMSLKWLHVFIQ